jgi:hypothetical protein
MPQTVGLLFWISRPSGQTHGGPPVLLFESGRLGTHGTKPHQNSSLPPTMKFVTVLDEGWQVVRSRRMRCCSLAVTSRPSFSHYLIAVEGKCLNCLSSWQRKADCHLPTHCFNYHRLRHHLRNCKRHQNSPAALGYSEAHTDATGRHVIRGRCGVSYAHPAAQAPCGTLPSLGDGGASIALAPTPSIACSFPKPNLASSVA